MSRQSPTVELSPKGECPCLQGGVSTTLIVKLNSKYKLMGKVSIIAANVQLIWPAMDSRSKESSQVDLLAESRTWSDRQFTANADKSSFIFWKD